MIYLSTGILDDYDNPKVDLESAVTKAFSQDILKNLLEFAFSLMGSSATMGSEEIQRDLLNALQLQNVGGTSDALKKYAATKGIQYCVVSAYRCCLFIVRHLSVKRNLISFLFCFRNIMATIPIITRIHFW